MNSYIRDSKLMRDCTMQYRITETERLLSCMDNGISEVENLIKMGQIPPDYEVAAYGGNGAKKIIPRKSDQKSQGIQRPPNSGHYAISYEPIAFGGEGAKPNQPRWFARYDQTTTWFIKPDANTTYAHPTQKPVELAERPILNSSREGEIVLDAFAGAGFSLIAAHKLKRIWRGIELDAKYCDVIIQRWEHYSGQEAVRVPAKK